MMERSPHSGTVLFIASAVVEMAVLGAFFQVSSQIKGVSLAAVFLVVPAFVVGYVAGQFGIVYGLALGVMPAVFALTVLPVASFGLSPVAGGLILFLVCVLLSGLSGVGGQSLALRRDAD